MKKLLSLILLACALPAMAADAIYSAVVTFTNQPSAGNELTVNSVTWTFESTITDATSQVQIGATLQDTADNYFSAIQSTPYTSIAASQDDLVVRLTGAANLVISASMVGSWGTVEVDSTTLDSYTVTYNFSDRIDRVAMADAIITGLADYASTAFEAGESVFANYLDVDSGKTATGTNTFSGPTILSNAATRIVGGALDGVTAEEIEINSTNDVIIFSGFYRMTMDPSGIPSVYEDAGGVNGAAASYAAGDATLINGLVGDSRYFRKTGANTLSGTNSFTGPVTFTDASGALDGTTVSAETLSAVDVLVTGDWIASNSAPSLHIVESDADADEQDWILSAEGGLFSFKAWNEDLDGSEDVFTVARTAEAVDEIEFPNGLVVLDALRVATTHWVEAQANFAGIVGIGTTNALPPTSMDVGLVITNGTPPSADPDDAIAIFSSAGEARYREPGSGSNLRLKNVGSQGQGAGSDYPLTGTYAQVTFGSGGNTITLPDAGTYLVTGLIAVDADGSTGDDTILIKLYNATDAADVSSSERQVSNIPAAKRGQVTLQNIVAVTASKTLHLYARNATAARGSIDSEQTSLSYLQLY